jgi:hypothetical protein
MHGQASTFTKIIIQAWTFDMYGFTKSLQKLTQFNVNSIYVFNYQSLTKIRLTYRCRPLANPRPIKRPRVTETCLERPRSRLN